MSEDANMTRRDEIETLLPFYLNGTLSGADLAMVEDWLAKDPNADAALAEAEGEFAFVNSDNEALRPHPNAFKRFSDALEKEPGPAVSPVSRLSAWLGRTFAVPAPLVWATAAAMVAFALTFATVGNFGGGALKDIEVAGSGETDKAAFVLVTFKPEAKMSDIAALLKGSGAQMADGPSASGAFKINVSAATIADYDAVSAALAQSPLVETLIPGRKPDEAK
jgi:anti-sigma-K factor RskA